MSTRRKSVNRMTAALHEAGHAVAAIKLGISFDFVTVVPDDISVAHVHGLSQSVPDYASHPDTKDEPKSLAFWERWLVVTMAGPAAHKKRHPYAHPWGYAFSDRGELFRLTRDIHRGSEDVRHAYEGYIRARAKELVEREWPSIEAVAAALVERGTLSYDDVHSACHAMIVSVSRAQSASSLVIHLGSHPRPGA